MMGRDYPSLLLKYHCDASSQYAGGAAQNPDRPTSAAVPLGIEGDLGGYDYLADWPEREPSKFHMRPSERDADNSYSQHNRGDEVA